MRFEHKLALALGKSVRELRRSMNSEELSRWIAYDQLDQIPDPVMLAARIMSVIANAMGSGKVRYTPHDFTGRRLPRARVQSPEAMRAMFIALTGGRGAR